MLASVELVSRIGIQTSDEKRLFSMSTLGEDSFVSDWLSSRYRVRALKRHTAKTLSVLADATDGSTVVIKIQADAPEQLIAEARIHRMLTTLWVNIGRDTETHSPIVKVYDYSRVPKTIELGTLSKWLSGGSNAVLGSTMRSALVEIVPEMRPLAQQPEFQRNPAGYVTQAFAENRKFPVRLALHVAEAASYTFDTAIGRYELWPALMLQFLLLEHILQDMLNFTHGDCAPENLFIVEVEQPVTLRYAVGTNAVFYVPTRHILKLADFSASRMDVPQPVNEQDSVPGGVTAARTDEYQLQTGDERDYRPWRDTMQLAWYAVAHFTNTGRSSPPMAVRELLATMLTIDAVSDTNSALAYDSNVFNGPGHRVDSAEQLRQVVVEKLPDRRVLLNDQRARREFETAVRQNVALVRTASAYYRPKHIIEKHFAFFRGLIHDQPPADVAEVIDMTLKIGDESSGMLERWNLPMRADKAYSDAVPMTIAAPIAAIKPAPPVVTPGALPKLLFNPRRF